MSTVTLMYVTTDLLCRLTHRSKLVVVENRDGALAIVGFAPVPAKAGPRKVREMRSRIREAASVAGYRIPESLDGNLEFHPVRGAESFVRVLNIEKLSPTRRSGSPEV